MLTPPDDLEQSLLPQLIALRAHKEITYMERPISKDYSGYWLSGGFVGPDAMDVIRFIRENQDWFT
jgi:hypothetical protein